MTNYQTGDKVKVMADFGNHCFPIGTILEVGTVITNCGKPYFKAKHSSNKCDPNWSWNVLFEEVVPVVEFKSGDRVKRANGHDFSNGKMEVTVDRVEEFGKSGVRIWLKETRTHIPPKDLVLVQPTRKFKVGDKVVPVKKSTYGRTLDSSVEWKRGKEQGFLYVSDFSKEENCYVLNSEPNRGYDGDFFKESDLIPYVEPQFKAGDKVRRKNGDSFSNGKHVLTVSKMDGKKVWLKETDTWVDVSNVQLAPFPVSAPVETYKGFKEGSEFLLYGEYRRIERLSNGQYRFVDNEGVQTTAPNSLKSLITIFEDSIRPLVVPAPTKEELQISKLEDKISDLKCELEKTREELRLANKETYKFKEKLYDLQDAIKRLV